MFLVETCSRKEVRQVRELFDLVGRLAQVVPISHGAIMSFAVQAHSDVSLFGKIECLLKTQFTFSIVERSFSEVTFRLVQSLCADSQTQMVELPECGICAAVDPFPARATLELAAGGEPLHAAYCARCAAHLAEEDADRFVLGLVKRDRRRFSIGAGTHVVVVPEMVTAAIPWNVDQLAIAG